MNWFEYLMFTILNPVNKKLQYIINNFRIKCNHTYPNGESALVEGEYSNTCKICGDNELNGNYYDSMEKAY